MKTLKTFLSFTFLFIAFGLFAQGNMEDVIYLKNGSIYRGTIIEQVPNQSYKIQIAGGSIIAVTVAEIEKITKEASTQQTAPRNHDHESYGWGHHGGGYGWGQHGNCKSDSSGRCGYNRHSKTFRSIEFRPGINNIGIRFVRGIKFNRHAYFGLGLGFDGVYFGKGISWGKGVYDNTNVHNGLYIPLYFHLSGDVLKRRVTPYYFVEAGYAFHPANPFADKNPTSKSWGGPTGAGGFGIRMHTKGRASFAVNVNATYRSDIFRTNITTIDEFGNEIKTRDRGVKHGVFGSLGFSVSF